MLDADSYKVVAQAPMPLQPQGESITMDLDGRTCWSAAKGSGRRCTGWRCPLRSTTCPEPERLTTADRDPDSLADPSEPPDNGEETEPQIPAEDGGGTLLAVGLAAAVALMAGAVVILIRKP